MATTDQAEICYWQLVIDFIDYPLVVDQIELEKNAEWKLFM